MTCRKSFSSQTFRFDFGQRKPWLNIPIAQALCSKVTLRKTAELLLTTRRSVERRLLRLGAHCRAFHFVQLERFHAGGGRLTGAMTLDELETFETDRLLQPVTVPILTEKHSWFVVDLRAAPLPARGRLRRRDQARKEGRERIHGKRCSGSSAAVRACLQTWRRYGPAVGSYVELHTDQKTAYRGLYSEVFSGRIRGMARVSAREKRDRKNALFVANVTNAMVRDGVSRLVRETWAHSKRRGRLQRHLWVWAVFRNYVRGLTRRLWNRSSAMLLGIAGRKYRWADVLRWRSPFLSFLPTHSKEPVLGHSDAPMPVALLRPKLATLRASTRPMPR
ncbi:MAG: hypothetical protein EYC70_10230 [Planctomycetota bacterium]|nr:MAG: hypothetical protein EYC70_10230 [Planctomycetota bacterium]